MLWAIGFPDAKGIDPSSTDPGALYDFLKAHVANISAAA